MEEGCVVRAVYDFHTDLEGELSLRVGQIIQVTKIIDKHWLHGLSGGNQGNFPSSFVIKVKIPMIGSNQKLFAATDTFVAQEEGDLSFVRGDIIIGKKQIDANWWFGECENRKGIFPLTHVWALNVKKLKMEEGPRKVNIKARVKMDLIAQLPEEIDLKRGEIITVTELTDKDWYKGISGNKMGTFPASFVTLLDELSTTETENNASLNNSSNIVQVPQIDLSKSNGFNVPNLESEKSVDVINQYGYDYINSGITPYGRTRSSFDAEYPNELSFGRGELITLIRYVDDKWMEGEIDGKAGLFPSDYIDVIVDCVSNNEKKESLNSIHSLKNQEYTFPNDTYGRVLYDYEPQVYGDLKLKEGDTVTLLRSLNPNWFEAMTDDGSFGLCPANFIEIISGSPFSRTSRSDSFSQNKINNWNESLKTENKPERPPPPYSSIVNVAETSKDDRFLSKNIDKNILFNITNFDDSSREVIGNDQMTFDNFSTSNRNISERSTDLLSYEEAIRQTQPLTHSNNYNTAADQVLNYMGENEAKQTIHSQKPISVSSTSSININNSSLHQITPCRPAPLLPVSRQSSSSSSSMGNQYENLCAEESLSNIQQDLVEKENKLERLERCKKKMRDEVDNGKNDLSVESELENQISIFDDEIDGLKKEIKILQRDIQRLMFNKNVDLATQKREADERAKRESLVEKKRKEELERQTIERKKKMKEQRQCVILELIQTEKDYLQDLRICHDTFLNDPEKGKLKGIDMANLFGNLDEVIDMASRLLKRLEKTMQQSNADHQLIGDCFIDLSEDLKEVYGHYCRNHDDIHALLDKYEENSVSAQYLKHGIEIMRRQTNCFDLRSVLIKPVQRILKYPLLLNELVKCTEDSHSDKNKLIKAVNLMTDVATAINEFKRRKDLVFKYRKDADTSLSTRISKLNLHSVRKKSSRFSLRLSSTIGLTSVMKDEVFESIVQQFRSLEKTIKIFLKDVNCFSENMQDYAMTALNVVENIADFYQDRNSQQEVDRLRTAHRTIVTQFWEDFKLSTEKHVTNPLKELLQTFNGPNNLIQKRHDKLLDYEACTSRLERNKDVTKQKMLCDEQQLMKNTYEALNSQLLDDLPKLCNIATEILNDCVIAFLQSRKLFLGRTARQMIDLMELPLLMGNKIDFLETFQVKHNLAIAKLSEFSTDIRSKFLGSTSTLKGDTIGKKTSPKPHHINLGSSPNNQTESQRAYLKSKYKSDCLCTIKESYIATDILDISVQEGDVVRVMKKQDPMGSSHRWFVDSGNAQGFVPAKLLVRLNVTDNFSTSNIQHSTIEPIQYNQSQIFHSIQSVQPMPITNLDNRNQSLSIPETSKLIEKQENLIDISSDSKYSNTSLNEFDPLSSISDIGSSEDGTDLYTSHRYEIIPDDDIPPANKTNDDLLSDQAIDEYYYAAYSFDGKGEHQLRLGQGQVVLVHHKSDLHGNKEWWFVEDRHGNQGYVPSNYLMKYTGN